MIKIFLLSVSVFIFVGINGCSDNSPEQITEPSVMAKVFDFCAVAGKEAQMAISARESGLSLHESLESVKSRHPEDQDMLSYANNIWESIYNDKETFQLENSEKIVRDVCFTHLMKNVAERDGSDPITYACKNQAMQTKKIAVMRDEGLSYNRFKSKMIKVTNKGDATLKTYGMEETGKNTMLRALDYVYSNKKSTPDELYRSYLSMCISKNSN